MALFLNGKKLSGEPHNYSTDEQVVGTWIDGSTIYEKVFVLSTRVLVAADYSTVLIQDTTIYGIENIISASGFDNNGGSDFNKIWALPNSLNFYKSNTNQIIVNALKANEYKLTMFVLRYTKTST